MEWCSRATISALTDLGIQRIGLKKWNTVAGGNEKKGFVNLLGSKKTPGISLSTHIHQHQQQQIEPSLLTAFRFALLGG